MQIISYPGNLVSELFILGVSNNLKGGPEVVQAKFLLRLLQDFAEESQESER